MITINLLPAEYRSAKKKTTARPYVPFAILIAGLFLLLTSFFFPDYLRARSAYDKVYKEWQQISPQMKTLKALESKVEINLRAEKEFYEKYVLNTLPATRILQWLSEYLPARAWLTEVKFEREGEGAKLVVQGVVNSMPGRTSIEQIEEYTATLKDLLPKGNFALTTAKQTGEGAAGTAFTATFDWGIPKP